MDSKCPARTVSSVLDGSLNVSRASRAGMHEYTCTRRLSSKCAARLFQGCKNTHIPYGWIQDIPLVPSRNAGIHIYLTAGFKVFCASRQGMQEYTTSRRLHSQDPARPVQECLKTHIPDSWIQSILRVPSRNAVTHIPDGWTQSIPRVPFRNGGIHVYSTAGLKVSGASRQRTAGTPV